MGADLVVIKDGTENSFLFNANFGGTAFWIGYTDRIRERHFQWVYVGEVCNDYANFKQGEPNYLMYVQDCVVFYSDTAQWDDEVCESGFSYVCEKRIYPDITPPSYGTTCQDDIHLFALPNGTNSFKLDWTPPTWTDDSPCALTLIDSQYSPGYVLEIPEGALNAFIVVKYTATDKTGNSNTCSFRISISDYPFECLNGGTLVEPEDASPYCLCTPLFGGLSCEHNDFSCEPGWMSYGTSCYKYFSTGRKPTWRNAQDECKSIGANLVVIKDVAENAFLYNARFGKDFWIGYTDSRREGYFEWVDGPECSHYTNFLHGQPKNYSSLDDCVLFKYSSGQWIDDYCGRYSVGYVCEKPFFRDYTPPSYGSTCPDDVNFALPNGKKSLRLDWTPPTWTDDSSCSVTSHSRYLPGHVLEIPEGAYSAFIDVTYIGTDLWGNSNTCLFRMSITNILRGNRCMNGGTMTIATGASYCTCPPGFKGLYCDVKRDISFECLNGGTLVESKFTDPYCLCLPGFIGLSCENNNCFNSPCKNNGTCAVDPISQGGYVCLCAQGFSGRLCDELRNNGS